MEKSRVRVRNGYGIVLVENFFRVCVGVEERIGFRIYVDWVVGMYTCSRVVGIFIFIRNSIL